MTAWIGQRTTPRTVGAARHVARDRTRIAVALLVGAFALLPAILPFPHHPPPFPPPKSAQTAPAHACIEGACHEAVRCIQDLVKHVVLPSPAPSLLVLALLLAIVPLARQLCVRIRPRDWWWPPDRRRAFLQVYLI